MTEVNCDAYISKLSQIQTICNDYNTTKTILQTKISELETIEENIKDDIINIGLETTLTFQHIFKFIVVFTTCHENKKLRSYLDNLAKLKREELVSVNSGGDNTITQSYGTEMSELLTYIDEIIDTPHCLLE